MESVAFISFHYPSVRCFHHDISVSREVDVVLKFLKEQCGAKHIGAVGFCWGGVATHYLALQYPDVKAGVSVYGMSHLFVFLFFFIITNQQSLLKIHIKLF